MFELSDFISTLMNQRQRSLSLIFIFPSIPDAGRLFPSVLSFKIVQMRFFLFITTIKFALQLLRMQLAIKWTEWNDDDEEGDGDDYGGGGDDDDGCDYGEDDDDDVVVVVDDDGGGDDDANEGSDDYVDDLIHERKVF